MAKYWMDIGGGDGNQTIEANKRLKDKLIQFIEPYYIDKDIMHNMWHLALVKKQADKIIELGKYEVNYEHLMLALSFHGFIYRDELKIREWLKEQNFLNADIEQIVKIAWESQRPEIPDTLEGKILHDAHVLEGGKTYTVVKTLITGSVRGQSLQETLDFMKSHVLDANVCYLPVTIPLCEEMNLYTNLFYKELSEGIQ